MKKLCLLLILTAFALAADDKWKLTGSAVVGVQIPIGYLKIYDLTHEMREVPSAKWKKAIQTADVDKRLTWTLLREAPKNRVADGLRIRLKENGLVGDPRIDQMISAFPDPVPEGARVVINFNAKTDVTTVRVDGPVGPQEIAGADFMRAVWGMYFGQGEWAERCGDQLLKNLW